MLQERIHDSDNRIAELQRRLEDEEQAHQALQLSASRVRAELQNEITELCGTLKLRAFETERAALTMEEVSASRQKFAAENEQLKAKVDVLRKEYYELDLKHREGLASEHWELNSLREQLRGYVEVEKELDAAIRAAAEGPLAAGRGAEAQPRSIDEALLIGTTLASAPTSAQRRIQQSLLLAQEVQRRAREAAAAKSALKEAQEEVVRLREDTETLRAEVRYSSEPQAYLLESLRRREGEVLGLKRELRARNVEVEQARQQVEHAVTAREQVEEDLKKLLAQREHLATLQAALGARGELADEGSVAAARAEHRGRMPARQPGQQQGQRPLAAASVPAGAEATVVAGPGWFGKLRSKLNDLPD